MIYNNHCVWWLPPTQMAALTQADLASVSRTVSGFTATYVFGSSVTTAAGGSIVGKVLSVTQLSGGTIEQFPIPGRVTAHARRMV